MTRAWVGPVRAAAAVIVGAGLVVAATQLPGTAALVPPAPAAATSAPRLLPVSSAALTCPGPETQGLAAVPGVDGTTTVLAAVAPAAALRGLLPVAAAGTLTVTARPSTTSLGETAARGQVVSAPLSGATDAEVSATATLAPGLAAVQTFLRADGDDRALVATPCLAPQSDLWLVGGGGQSTRRERIVLANPGANPVTASLSVLGVAGPVALAGSATVAVLPHGRTTLLLDAIAGPEAAPVVHVTATGGMVSAVLADSWIDAAVGRGADDATPSAAPSTEQVVPAALIDGPARLRVAVPGDSEAVVQTRVLTPTGPKPLPAGGVVRIKGGSVQDIDLGALPAGAYAVQVRSDQPVVAGAMVERRSPGAGQSDFAWIASSLPIPLVTGTPVPAAGPAGSATLTLVATGTPATATVTTIDTGGKTVTTSVTVPTDSVVSTPVPAGQVWVTRLSGTLRAGLTIAVPAGKAVGPLFTAYPLGPLSVSANQVPVRQVG